MPMRIRQIQDTRYLLCLSLGSIGFYQHARSLQRASAQKSQRNGSDCIHTTHISPCLLCCPSFHPLLQCWLSGANCGCGCDCGAFDRICQIHSVERVRSCVSACGAGIPGQGCRLRVNWNLLEVVNVCPF